MQKEQNQDDNRSAHSRPQPRICCALNNAPPWLLCRGVKMTWVRVDDSFWSDPLFSKLTDGAQALWLRANTYIGQHLTDGFIPDDAMQFLRVRKRYVDELVSSGIWQRVSGGALAVRWRENIRPRDAVLAQRLSTKTRVQKLRNGVTNAARNTTPVPGPVSLSSLKPLEEITEPSSCASASYASAHTIDRAPVGEAPPDVPLAEAPPLHEIVTAHALAYGAKRMGEKPRFDYRAAGKLWDWCIANASAHRTTPRKLAERVVAGLFENPKAAQKRWPLAYAAHDPAEYLSAPPGSYVAHNDTSRAESAVAHARAAFDERLKRAVAVGDEYEIDKIKFERDGQLAKIAARHAS